jgi:hypothetical protein
MSNDTPIYFIAKKGCGEVTFGERLQQRAAQCHRQVLLQPSSGAKRRWPTRTQSPRPTTSVPWGSNLSRIRSHPETQSACRARPMNCSQPPHRLAYHPIRLLDIGEHSFCALFHPGNHICEARAETHVRWCHGWSLE